MTRKTCLNIVFGVVFVAAFSFIAVLAVPSGPLATARLAQVH
jgi:ABC-type thiamin/hydroxymethylpyrimidine transport system permease subunit